MAEPKICQDCVTGAKEGEDKLESFAGVKCFIARPPKKSKNAILYITDVFGPTLQQAQENCKVMAEAGYLVVIPDLFNGDSVDGKLAPSELMALFPTWFPKHVQDTKLPICENTIKELKEKEGIEKIGFVSYCYGAPIALRLAQKGLGNCWIVAHPSFIDPSKDLKGINTPGFFVHAGNDAYFTEEARKKCEEETNKLSVKVAYKTYPDVPHGFAARGGEGEHVNKMMHEALHDIIAFFNANLSS